MSRLASISTLGVLWASLVALDSQTHSVPPAPAISVPVTVQDVYDGDTLTAVLSIPMRVRLEDCWAPELRQPGGRESAANLRSLAAGKAGVLHVDLDEVRRLDDVLSFGRVVGRLWVGNADLSVEQIRAGHAKERP